MEIKPNQLIRLLQLGEADTALRSAAIWRCVSCQTCSSRCPKTVDCAAVLDALRQIALERGLAAREQQPVIAFQRAFLDNVRRNGRLNEIELIARFKLNVVRQTGRLGFAFKDAGLAPQLSQRKKLHLFSEKAHDRGLVDRIFARCAS
jgi:heterodisulfide reductase subunit C